MQCTLKCQAEGGSGLGVRLCTDLCEDLQSPWAEQGQKTQQE